MINHFEIIWDKTINSIYFWWWTPSLLSSKQINEIISIFEENWKLDENIELTLECNPENLSKKYLENLKSTKINRLSIWVQSLNNEVLKEIGRKEKSVIINALENVWKTWFANIWIDFIIWLPHEKKFWVSKNIEEILEKYSFIKHVSIYVLEWNYPDKWRNISIKEENLLNEYILAKNILEKNSFWQYEISNFAKKWYECKHNKSYWSHSNYRWFWVSWASYIDNVRFANASKLWDYYKWVLDYKEKLTNEDIRLEKLMFDIRTWWILLEEITNKDKINSFINDWLVKINNEKIILTDKWIFISDYILKEFI